MWNTPNQEELAKIPRLYATEETKLEEKIIYMHFFVGGCDWWIAEYDGQDSFFGFANLGDPQMAEWGYISFRELKELTLNMAVEVDRDKHWQLKKFSEVWPKP